MSLNGWLQIAIYGAIIVLLARPLGSWTTRVFAGETGWFGRVLGPVEHGLYRLAGVNPAAEQHWTSYTVGTLAFNLLGFLAVFAIQRFQAFLPVNSAEMAAVRPDLAFNTAASFATNTN
jgi:K+-transporting ATPase ATPase A chain